MKVAPTTKEANGAKKTKLHAPKKLSLGCGQSKPEGYFGIDIMDVPGVDLLHNLWEMPWPIKTNSVEELQCSHLVEHIPHWRPAWEKDGWFMFFDEVYRVCKKDAICSFQHPYVMNGRAFWDPTHTRFIHETTWYYLNREWRKSMLLDHYPTEVDFEVSMIEGIGVDPTVQAKHHEAQAFSRNHYWNVISDLVVVLKVLK